MPFDIRDFGGSNTDTCKDQIAECVASYKAHSDIYRRLLAGEAAGEFPDYQRFADGAGDNKSGASDLENFIRTSFHPDVLFGYLALEFEKTLNASVKSGIATPWAAGPLWRRRSSLRAAPESPPLGA